MGLPSHCSCWIIVCCAAALCWSTQVAQLRYVLVTKGRADMLEKMEDFATSGQVRA